jgi:16S rRNA (guanine527-N7)-methyltransferase
MPTDAAIGQLSSLLQGLRLPASVLSPLLAHAEAVEIEADRLGLVSKGDASNVLTRHTTDSLGFALARRPRPDARWVDVGSGAGFPGLPLAICFASTRFTLIEPQQRRAGFLDLQVSNLGLENVTVLAMRAEDVAARFQVGTARALAHPEAALARVGALLEPGGEAIVAVGSQESWQGKAFGEGARLVEVPGFGVDSPGRLLMMTRPSGGATE